jgi:hypothetical protein
MKKKHFFILALLSSCFLLTAQQKLSPKATVSVVTCGPGNVLYSAFGHSAFRIYDPLLGLDKVYNYGTFDFEAPNFYLNFAKGKLTYQLSTSSFSRFLRVYHYENRWVKTQELNLELADVQAVFNFLENNAKPENKSYQYDFFYDNCSTKIEEVINSALKEKVIFSNSHITTNKTHRDLISDYTKNHKWGKFGIDLALGSVIDKNATKNEYKFLPDYIYQAFENATLFSKKPLVRNTRSILKEKMKEKPFSLLQPLTISLLIALFILAFTYKNYTLKKRTKWIDFILNFTTGLIGVAVLLLWFATTHTATYKNFNFLWAFAPNLVIAFYMLKSKLPKWVDYYNWVLLLLLVVMILFWLLQIQVFNTAIIPFILALAIRYCFLIKLEK